MSVPADLLVVGGAVLTGDPARPRAEALAVRQGRIVAAGRARRLLELRGPGTRVVELADGACVLPGFHDAHMHLAHGSLSRLEIDLRTADSPPSVVERVVERAQRMPAGAWLRGWGWDQARWPDPRWPTRGELDLRVPHHPVFLSRIDGHAAWLNGRALHALGISSASPDPPGGTIVRDPSTGEPTGLLLEAAMERARSRLPALGFEDRRAALESTLRELAAAGVTSVQDVADAEAPGLYAALNDEGRLTVRVSVWLPLETDLDAAEALRRRFPAHDPWVAVTTLKGFLDGTLGSRTAALDEAYADDPENRGLLRSEPGELEHRVGLADAAGWSVALHAIGDRAVGVALDALGKLPHRDRPRPHRIEHLQLARDADLDRLARLGVAASIQPVHLEHDALWVMDRLGPGRAARAYPARALLERGVTVALGSDWPVASLRPLRGVLRAVRRVVAPQEALSVSQAIAGYTRGAARAAGRGGEIGSLAPDKRADFVVLAEDPSAQAPEELECRATVQATYVEGRLVHPGPV